MIFLSLNISINMVPVIRNPTFVEWCLVVGFTTTYAISAYRHWSSKFESRTWLGVLDITFCDKVYQWHAAGL
jgi:hypothetical protein